MNGHFLHVMSFQPGPEALGSSKRGVFNIMNGHFLHVMPFQPGPEAQGSSSREVFNALTAWSFFVPLKMQKSVLKSVLVPSPCSELSQQLPPGQDLS